MHSKAKIIFWKEKTSYICLKLMPKLFPEAQECANDNYSPVKRE